MYAIKEPEGEVTFNKDEIIRVVEDFYRDLYNSNEQPRMEANGQPGIEANAVTRDVPNIATEEIKRALKGMKREKTPDEDGISIQKNRCRRNCNSETSQAF